MVKDGFSQCRSKECTKSKPDLFQIIPIHSSREREKLCVEVPVIKKIAKFNFSSVLFHWLFFKEYLLLHMLFMRVLYFFRGFDKSMFPFKMLKAVFEIAATKFSKAEQNMAFFC